MAGSRSSWRSRGGALGIAAARRSLHCLMLGRHAAMPAALSAAVGLALGLDWEQMQQGLTRLGYGHAHPRPGQRGVTLRMMPISQSQRREGALQVLAELPGRRVAVLGDMLD